MVMTTWAPVLGWPPACVAVGAVKLKLAPVSETPVGAFAASGAPVVGCVSGVPQPAVAPAVIELPVTQMKIC